MVNLFFKRFLFILSFFFLFIGCASSLELRDPIDPYEEQNRKIHEFNEKVIENLIEPVTGAYVKATPPFVRDRVTDFFENISDVKSGINITPLSKSTFLRIRSMNSSIKPIFILFSLQ